MISITADPGNSERLILTQTTTLYLEKLALAALSSEVETAIRSQARKDLIENETVKKEIATAATRMLLKMLGAEPEKANQ